MSDCFDNNNLLEMVIELQYKLYITSTNKKSINAKYLHNLNIMIEKYIKYGNNGDDLINIYYDAQKILYLIS